MFDAYVRLMDLVHKACLWCAGIGIIVISLIIPWGVFTRYVLQKGSQWPEPMAILIMIVISFVSAAVCYRDNLHIGVMMLPNALTGAPRVMLGLVIELLMLATNLFMLVWGLELVRTTWNQTIAEFPTLSVGITYLPIPVGGAIVSLFVIERIWSGRYFQSASDDAVAAAPTE